MLSNQSALFTLTAYAFVEKVFYKGDFGFDIIGYYLRIAML